MRARTPCSIGTHLTLRLPDRRDLIVFKNFAAADAAHGRQPVHKSVLRAMSPSDEELLERLAEHGLVGSASKLREFAQML